MGLKALHDPLASKDWGSDSAPPLPYLLSQPVIPLLILSLTTALANCWLSYLALGSSYLTPYLRVPSHAHTIHHVVLLLAPSDQVTDFLSYLQ